MKLTPETPLPAQRTDSNYRSSLEWLYRQSRGHAPRDPSRMEQLMEALELRPPARNVHVVGTNGKGTVTTMVTAAAHGAGLRSGCFTSPHVEDFCERISVDGRNIDRDHVIAFVDRVRTVSLPFTPAFFELTLALAIDHFAHHGVELAAIEAGVGARNDATAALGNIEATAITPISHDHLETIGPSLRDIAWDKSAAIRGGVPVASARQIDEVARLLTQVAAAAGSRFEIDLEDNKLFTLPSGMAAPRDPVRQRNARLAAATLRLLGDIPEHAIKIGLLIPPLPGRGERFQVGEVTVILDGAHDPAAAHALVERAGGSFVLLFGSLRRKLGEQTLRELETSASEVFVTTAGGDAITVESRGHRRLVVDPAEALASALDTCAPGGLLVIAGSLYLAGELRPRLRALSGSQTPSRQETKASPSGTEGR